MRNMWRVSTCSSECPSPALTFNAIGVYKMFKGRKDRLVFLPHHLPGSQAYKGKLQPCYCLFAFLLSLWMCVLTTCMCLQAACVNFSDSDLPLPSLSPPLPQCLWQQHVSLESNSTSVKPPVLKPPNVYNPTYSTQDTVLWLACVCTVTSFCLFVIFVLNFTGKDWEAYHDSRITKAEDNPNSTCSKV